MKSMSISQRNPTQQFDYFIHKMTYPTAFAMVRVLLSLRMTLNVSDRYIQEQTLFIYKPTSHPSTNGVFVTICVSTYQNAIF